MHQDAKDILNLNTSPVNMFNGQVTSVDLAARAKVYSLLIIRNYCHSNNQPLHLKGRRQQYIRIGKNKGNEVSVETVPC